MSHAAAVLARYVSAVDAQALGAYGVHVLVDDDAAQHRWRSDDRENIYSVSKGVCALAIGIAIDEHVLTLDTTIADALPELITGRASAQVTVRDLLSMSSGIDFRWFADEPAPWPDLAQEMVQRPSHGRGTVFQYTDASPYVAMRMLAARVGDVRDWLMPRLFDPLQIHNPQWQRCPQGFIFGASGLELRTEELARIGRLLRDRGDWRGTQLVSPQWVDRMHSDWLPAGGDGNYAHYGLGAWQGPGQRWRLDGRYGQYVVIDQSNNAVITVTAHEEFRDARLAEIAREAIDG